MWWWNFNKEEPLQEDLMTYERFMEIREDRRRMNEDKRRQKEQARSKGVKSSTTYNIPDP